MLKTSKIQKFICIQVVLLILASFVAGCVNKERMKVGQDVPYRISDKDVFEFSNNVRHMLRAKREWFTISGYITGGFSMAAAATAATLGVASGNVTAIASLSASSLFANDMFGLLKFREKAASYEDGLSLIEQAEARFLRANAKNYAQSKTKGDNKTHRISQQYIGDVDESLALENTSGSISNAELSIEGARLYTEVIASIQLVEKALVAHIPTLAEVQRATGKYSLFQVTPSSITLDSESQIQITVISGGMIKDAGTENSNVIEVKPFNYQEGTKTITLVAKGEGETVVNISNENKDRAKIEVSVKELYAFFDAASSDNQGSEAKTDPNIFLSLSTPTSRRIEFDIEADTEQSTATSGKDFSLNTKKIIFQPGEVEKKVPLKIKTDDLYEPGSLETVKIKIIEKETPIRGDHFFEYKILDSNGTPELKFKSLVSNATEPKSKPSSHKVEVTLSHRSTKNVVAPYEIAEITSPPLTPLNQATGNEDFKIVKDKIIFDFENETPGQTVSLSQEIDVSILADDVYEANQQFQIQFKDNRAFASSTKHNVDFDTTQPHTITILDSDQPPFAKFNVANSNATEKSLKNHGIRVNLTQATDYTVQVPYEVTDGSAIKGQDYSLSSGVVTFAPKTTIANIPYTVTADNIYEGNNYQDFSVELADQILVSGTLINIQNAKLNDNKKHVVSITDSDPKPKITIKSATIEKNEESQPPYINIPITLSSASEEFISLKYSITGKAKNREDFEVHKDTFKIKKLSKKANLEILIKDDSTYEGNESFTVTFLSTTDAELVGEPQVKVNLIDNDKPSIGFELSNREVKLGNERGPLVLKIVSEIELATDLTIDFGLDPDAENPADEDSYTLKPHSRQLTIKKGEKVGEITVTPIEGRFKEPQNISLLLKPSGDYEFQDGKKQIVMKITPEPEKPATEIPADPTEIEESNIPGE